MEGYSNDHFVVGLHLLDNAVVDDWDHFLVEVIALHEFGGFGVGIGVFIDPDAVLPSVSQIDGERDEWGSRARRGGVHSVMRFHQFNLLMLLGQM